MSRTGTYFASNARPEDRHQIVEWTNAYLAKRGAAPGALIDIKSGKQANCYLFASACDFGEILLAVKSFRNGINDSRTAENEFNALQRLHEALQGQSAISSPQPLVLLPKSIGAGYLMTGIRGSVLAEDVMRRPPTDIAIDIVKGLSLYHSSVGEPYSDFQPDNLIVAESGSIFFLDPSTPNVDHGSLERQLLQNLSELPLAKRLMAVDLGYWTYSVISRAVLGRVRKPNRTQRLIALTRALKFVAQREPMSLDYNCIVRVARAHARALSSRRSFYQKLVGWCCLVQLSGVSPDRERH
jgi:hypothetical protein